VVDEVPAALLKFGHEHWGVLDQLLVVFELGACEPFVLLCSGHAAILLSILVRSTSVGEEIWSMTMSLSSPASRISSRHSGPPQPCEGQARGTPTEGLDTYSTRQLLQKACPQRCRSICEYCKHAEHLAMFAELMAAITGASFAYASSNSAWVRPATISMLTLPLALPFFSPSFFHTISLSPAFTSA
jgi:hypothetical protein